jgi:hypothetical protein
MAETSFQIGENGEIILSAEEEDGIRREARFDPADERLDFRARQTGGFEIEFPDGEGGTLVIAFVPDLSVPELNVKAGTDRENLLQLAALTPV